MKFLTMKAFSDNAYSMHAAGLTNFYRISCLIIGAGYNFLLIARGRYGPLDIVMQALLVIILVFYKILSKYTLTHHAIFGLWIYFFTTLNLYIVEHLDTVSHGTLYLMSYNWGLVHGLVELGLPNIKYVVPFEIYGVIFRFCIAFSKFSLAAALTHVAIILLMVVARVRTERMNLKFFQELMRSRETLVKFKDFMAQLLPIGLVILNHAKDNILFVNQSFQEMFNLQEKENVLKKLQEISVDNSNSNKKSFFDEPRTKSLLKTIKEVKDTDAETQSRILCSYEDQNQQKLSYEVKLFQLKWDSEDAHAILLQDISHQNAISTLTSDNLNKEKAISVVAHELRNPINGLLGITQLMEKHTREAKTSQFLSIIKTNINLLLSILNSILDIQQIKANKLTLNITKVSLSEITKNLTMLYEYQFLMKNLEFKTVIEKSIDDVIISDQNRLSQILINLIANALKFTLKGGITLSIGPDPSDETKIIFRVTDTGIGIMPTDCNKLFQMFGKLDSPGLNQEGVGLGLVISNSLVKALNRNDECAQIQVESNRGQGSTFYFSIPVAFNEKSEEISIFIPEELSEEQLNFDGFDESSQINNLPEFQGMVKNFSISQQSPGRHLEPPNLLRFFEASGDFTGFSHNTSYDYIQIKEPSKPTAFIVDDNYFNIIVVQEMLKDKGMNSYYAMNGKDAISKIEALHSKLQKIHFILMDCEMPIMDGFTATKQLKDKMVQNDLPSIPIIGLSGNQQDVINQKLQEAGMDGYICKPFRESDLKKIVTKYVKHLG